MSDKQMREHESEFDGEAAMALFREYNPDALKAPEPDATGEGILLWEKDGDRFFGVVCFDDGKTVKANVIKLSKEAPPEQQEAFKMAAMMTANDAKARAAMQNMVMGVLAKVCQCPSCKEKRGESGDGIALRS